MTAASATEARPPTGVATEITLRRYLLIGLCIIAFLIYCAAVLVVRVEQRDDFIQERSSIAAAVSHLYYGAPLGNVYATVLERLLDFNVPLSTVLGEASQRKIPAQGLLSTTADGNGIGYIVVATVSMGLLGPHSAALVIALLASMAVSAAAFVWRFRDQRAIVVVLYFTVLTVMLFTPLTTERVHATQIGLAGIRYFAFVSILPAFHLILELFDSRRDDEPLPRWAIVPTALQVMILVLTFLVRNASAPVLGVVAVGAVIAAWNGRRLPGISRRILAKALYMAMHAVVLLGVLMLSFSESYLRDGRFTEVVWHRIFLSLGTSSQWPFPGVRELYDCRKWIPEGIEGGMPDRNSHCILWLYAEKHKIPNDLVPTLTYGRVHETALKEAFFDIVKRYPIEALEAFTYHKVKYIARSMVASIRFSATGSWFLNILPWLALANLLAFAAAAMSRRPFQFFAPIMVTSGLLTVFCMSPYFTVWAMVHTSGDLLFHVFFIAGLATVAALTWLLGRSFVRVAAVDLAWDPPGRFDPTYGSFESLRQRWPFLLRGRAGDTLARIRLPRFGATGWLLAASIALVAVAAAGGLVHHHRVLRVIVKDGNDLRRQLQETRQELNELRRELGALHMRAAQPAPSLRAERD